MLAYLVLHYKNADITKQCLESLLQTGLEESCIVVVDNASGNGSFEELRSQYGGNNKITFLLNKENLGYAAGNNVGFRYAKEKLGAEWIVLLNNDVVLEQRDFRETLLEEYEREPFYVAGPDIVTPEGNSQNPFRMECPDRKRIYKSLIHDYVVLALMKIGLQQKLKKALHYDGSIFQHNDTGTIRDFQGVLHGSCLIFSPDFIRRFDGLYGGTFLYCEEEILCFILKRQGCSYCYLKSLQVIHRHSATMKREIKDEDRRKMTELRNRIDSYRKFLHIAKNKGDLGDYLLQS